MSWPTCPVPECGKLLARDDDPTRPCLDCRDAGRTTPAQLVEPDSERPALDKALQAEVYQQRIRRQARQILDAEQRPPIPALLRLDELLARPVPELRWRVERLWPRHGRIILAAQAKTGKTTLRDNLARCLVDGGKFLDAFAVEPVDGTTCILDFELSEENLQRWLRDQQIRDEWRLHVMALRGRAAAFDLFDPDRRTEWARLLRAHNVRVLIVDCLGPILGAFGLDESKGVDVGRWLAAFEALLGEAGVDESAVVHHMGHNGERSRGASRLRDWPDAEWKLVRAQQDDGDDAPDPTRYFSAFGRDVDEPEGALRYDPMDRHLTLAGGSRARAKAARDLPALLDWLRQHPSAAKGDIENAADEMGISRNGCRKALALGIRQGDVCRHTPRGRRQNHYVKSECDECATIRHPQPADSSDV